MLVPQPHTTVLATEYPSSNTKFDVATLGEVENEGGIIKEEKQRLWKLWNYCLESIIINNSSIRLGK